MKTMNKIVSMVLTGLVVGATVATGTFLVTDHYADKAAKVQLDKYTEDRTALEGQIAELTQAVEDGKAVQADLEVVKASLQALEEQKARDDEVMKMALEELDKLKAEQAAEQSLQEDADTKVLDDLSLGAALSNVTLDNGDLDFLYDGQIEFMDEDYDVEEQIVLTDDLAVYTSLAEDEDFKENPALIFANEGAIEYRYVFKDALNYTQISEDDELVIDMLGKKMVIIGMDSNSMTVLNGQDHNIFEGDSVTVDGKLVTVLTVAEDKIQVMVAGKSAIIDAGETEDVNGLSIRATDIVYSAKDTVRSIVVLTIADQDAEMVIDNGDEYVDGDKTYEWVISTTGDNVNYIGVKHAEKADDADEGVLLPGDKMSFAGLFNVGFEIDGSYDYAEFEVSFDEVTPADIPVVAIKSMDGKKLIVGNEELEEAFTNGTLTYYKDSNNDWVNTTTAIVIENDDLSYDVDITPGGILTIGDMELNVSGGLTHFGATADEAEAADLIVSGYQLGTREHAVLLEDGTVVEAPESDLDKDVLVFRMPSDVVETKLIIGK